MQQRFKTKLAILVDILATFSHFIRNLTHFYLVYVTNDLILFIDKSEQ